VFVWTLAPPPRYRRAIHERSLLVGDLGEALWSARGHAAAFGPRAVAWSLLPNCPGAEFGLFRCGVSVSAPAIFCSKGLLRPAIINLGRAAYAEPAPKEITSDFGNRLHGHSTPRRLWLKTEGS